MPYFMILRLGPAIFTLCCVFEVRPAPPSPVGRTPFPLPVEASPFSQLITHHDADAHRLGRRTTMPTPGCRAVQCTAWSVWFWLALRNVG